MKLGGLSRRQTFLNQVRGRGDKTLLVDGGDCFFGPASKRKSTATDENRKVRTARRILDAYNFMGYQALAVGPSDLQFGVETLKELVKDARFPVLCANLIDKEKKQPAFESSTVVTVDGVRFGLYGLCLDSLHPTFRDRILGDRYELVDPLEAASTVVPELRKRCDVVIALSHINIDDNERMIDTVAGIDLVIDPYSRSGNQPVWITEGEYVIRRGNTPLLRIDGQGSRIGVAHLYFDNGPRERFVEFDAYDYPLEPHIFDHPEIVDLVAGKTVTGWQDRDPQKVHLLSEHFLGDETCGSCHEEQLAFWKRHKHSNAFAVLVNDKNEHLAGECIECHSTGYGLSFARPETIGSFKNVGCESCHGAGHLHPEDPKRYRMNSVSEERCWGCHNPEILNKPFDIAAGKPAASCPKMEK